MEEARIFSVKEITRYIRMKLESDGLLADVWLRGEISNFTHHTSGHMYFTLKDEASRIKCVMFAAHNRRLPFTPRDGTKVIARGSVTVYERDGNYQFYVTQMQPDGIGSLYLAFEQLKRKLEAEGLFDPARKRPLPRFPRTIGVVTSPTGAAIRDILTTLGRRYPQAKVALVPVLVQGEGAAPSIVRAIELLNRLGEADVMIVGRGGGSIEELWAFNEEIVARAIAASRIPVISAVGHETDFTIADFVADLRAPTPTAAAELAVPHVLELKETLEHLKRRMRGALAAAVESRRQRLERIRRSPVLLYPRRYLLAHAERLDRAAGGADAQPGRAQPAAVAGREGASCGGASGRQIGVGRRPAARGGAEARGRHAFGREGRPAAPRAGDAPARRAEPAQGDDARLQPRLRRAGGAADPVDPGRAAGRHGEGAACGRPAGLPYLVHEGRGRLWRRTLSGRAANGPDRTRTTGTPP